jgi:hypothetical protein
MKEHRSSIGGPNKHRFVKHNEMDDNNFQPNRWIEEATKLRMIEKAGRRRSIGRLVTVDL